jgi:phospholipid/cholesterol/gamma-HCH transport system permease protein
MAPSAAKPGAVEEFGRSALAWLTGWWRTVHLGALILIMCLAPASHTRAMRLALARQIYLSCASTLPWFMVLSSLISLVLIRIVVVTSVSYGLSQYALEMVVRVLVLELIPLTAALFAALRFAIPHGTEVSRLRAEGLVDARGVPTVGALATQVLPRVVAAAFCVLILAAMSCVLTLVLAYLSVYGFTRFGFAGYTHDVGQVFSGAVSLIFSMKIAFFSLAVALIPVASVLHDSRAIHSRSGFELRSLLRLFMVILMVEVASLVFNYS